GYSLVIDHKLADGTGTADIVSNSSEFVLGVVYSVPQSSVGLLDSSEGNAYQRIDNFQVTSLTTGQTLNVSIYVVISPESNVPPPPEAYADDLLNGIAEHNLGVTYSKKINLIVNPPPPPPPPSLTGDLNHDGAVNLQDFILVLQNFGQGGP